MRFQVLSSTLHCSLGDWSSSDGDLSSLGSHRMSFDALPCKSGELKFSDGNRLVANDLSKNWDRPLNMGELYGDAFTDGGKWPLGSTITIVTHDPRKNDILKDEEFACGYAQYDLGEHGSAGKGLIIYIYVDPKVFAELLQARLDVPTQMFFDVDIRGLKDQGYHHDQNYLQGTWDLDDKSDCGRGDCRVVISFNIERIVPYGPRNRQIELLGRHRAEELEESAKLYSGVSELLAIEKGYSSGAVQTLLQLNLAAMVIIIIIGILALISLYT